MSRRSTKFCTYLAPSLVRWEDSIQILLLSRPAYKLSLLIEALIIIFLGERTIKNIVSLFYLFCFCVCGYKRDFLGSSIEIQFETWCWFERFLLFSLSSKHKCFSSIFRRRISRDPPPLKSRSLSVFIPEKRRWVFGEAPLFLSIKTTGAITKKLSSTTRGKNNFLSFNDCSNCLFTLRAKSPDEI